jgi:hypothetical protein
LNNTGTFGTALSARAGNNGVIATSFGSGGCAVDGIATASTGVSDGVRGSTNSSAGHGVIGVASAGGTGVQGESASGVGVRGTSSNIGVVGTSTGAGGCAVDGSATATTGLSDGVRGSTSSPDGRAVIGFTTAGIGGYFQTLATNRYAAQAWAPGPANLGLFVRGRLVVQGRKSGTVEIEKGKGVLLYALETPEPVFEDLGRARLKNGVAVVPIEPTFARTVDPSDANYLVFLTPEGPNNSLYIASKTATSFEVRSMTGPDITFNWRAVVKQKGSDNVRLEEIDLPEPIKQ